MPALSLCDGAAGEVDVDDTQLREAITDDRRETIKGTNTAATGKVLKVKRLA